VPLEACAVWRKQEPAGRDPRITSKFWNFQQTLFIPAKFFDEYWPIVSPKKDSIGIQVNG
jgi:hypothetical protein